MVTVVFLKPRIADGDAGLGFEAPVAGENPGITVFPTEGKEVTLKAAILDGFVKSKGNLGITHVEMAVDGIQLQIADLTAGVYRNSPEGSVCRLI